MLRSIYCTHVATGQCFTVQVQAMCTIIYNMDEKALNLVLIIIIITNQASYLARSCCMHDQSHQPMYICGKCLPKTS